MATVEQKVQADIQTPLISEIRFGYPWALPDPLDNIQVSFCFKNLFYHYGIETIEEIDNGELILVGLKAFGTEYRTYIVLSPLCYFAIEQYSRKNIDSRFKNLGEFQNAYKRIFGFEPDVPIVYDVEFDELLGGQKHDSN